MLCGMFEQIWTIIWQAEIARKNGERDYSSSRSRTVCLLRALNQFAHYAASWPRMIAWLEMSRSCACFNECSDLG
jgi:hypothetical protein